MATVTIRTPDEIAAMRRSGALAAQILKELVTLAAPGVTTEALDDVARARIVAAKADPAFLGYDGFPATICTSVNNVAVHGAPSKQALKEGDLLGIDFGVVIDGWYSDVAVSLPIGRVSEEATYLLDVTQEALRLGIEVAVPGGRVGDISAMIQQYVESHGFQVIRELTGHGVGRKLHDEPAIPNFGKAGTGPELVEGMVIAIEPIVAVSAKHVRLGADGFGYETEDGSLAAHFEHTVAITNLGPEILTVP